MGKYADLCLRLLRTRFVPVATPWQEPVVDAGGGLHKAEVQKALGRAVETWDFQQFADVDRIVDLETCKGIPDGHVGTLICTSVLEHVERPWRVAWQLGRIVRPGGCIFVTAPFLFCLHEHPADYYRYSVDGLRVLFRDAFEELDAMPFVAIPGEREGSLWIGRRR